MIEFEKEYFPKTIEKREKKINIGEDMSLVGSILASKIMKKVKEQISKI